MKKIIVIELRLSIRLDTLNCRRLPLMQCWTPFYNLCYFKCFWSICMQDIISVLSILSTRPNFFVSLSYCLNTPFTLSLQFLHTTFPLSANAYALYSISSWVNMLTLLMLLPYFKEFIGLCISLYWSSRIGLIRGRKICSTICVITSQGFRGS